MASIQKDNLLEENKHDTEARTAPLLQQLARERGRVLEEDNRAVGEGKQEKVGDGPTEQAAQQLRNPPPKTKKKDEAKYDRKKEGMELNHPAHRHQRRNADTPSFRHEHEEESKEHVVGRTQLGGQGTGYQRMANEPVAAHDEAHSQRIGTYQNPFTAQEEIMTDNQTTLYIFLNFTMTFMLLVAVNTNIDAQCGSVLKSWIVIFAMILSMKTLVEVFGIDIQQKSATLQRAHSVLRIAQYMTSVSWLLYGNYIYFGQQITCQYEAPWLSFTALCALFFGYVQLFMFATLVLGISWWACCKLFGLPCSFTPQSLWRDQQQLMNQDQEVITTEQNKKLASSLRELGYGNYRREIRTDMIYGFVKGDPNAWRERDSFDEDEEADGVQETKERPHCAICMDYFREEDIVSPMPCHVNHLFHTPCIRPWILRNKSCPLCKYVVNSPQELSNNGSFMLNTSISQQNSSVAAANPTSRNSRNSRSF